MRWVGASEVGTVRELGDRAFVVVLGARSRGASSGSQSGDRSGDDLGTWGPLGNACDSSSSALRAATAPPARSPIFGPRSPIP